MQNLEPLVNTKKSKVFNQKQTKTLITTTFLARGDKSKKI
jgi:hypothetical protein